MTNSEPLEQTILVVDDNMYTLEIVQHALERADFGVMLAHSGEKGLESILKNGLPQLAVVDLNMPPGMSGFDFCQAVHQFSDLPVIMLTAIDEESTVLAGLETHAEDYITKPFNPKELVARIRRVLRRIGIFTFPSNPLTQVDVNLSVNFPKRKLVVDGEQISLTPIESKLLYILMRRPEKIVPSEFIIRRIWPEEPVYEDRLHVHMHRLRSKIDKQTKAKYIVSHRGQGYTFQPSQTS